MALLPGVTVILLSLLVASQLAASTAWKGTLCSAPAADDSARFACVATVQPRIELGTAPVRFYWRTADRRMLIVGTSLNGSIALDAEYAAFRVQFDVDVREVATNAEARFVLARDRERLTATLDRGILTALREVRVAPGTYDLSLDLAGWRRVFRPALRLSTAKPLTLGRIAFERVPRITGRALRGADRQPISGATIETPDGAPLATTNADGRFVADGIVDLPLAIVARAPGVAAHVEAIRQTTLGDVDLGDILLQEGSTLTVHLVRTCTRACATELVLARLQAFDPRPFQWSRVGTRSAITPEATVVFEGLERGRYMLIAQGERPLQRKAVAVNVDSDAVATSVACEDARVHGHVTSGATPLAHARLRFIGDEHVWTANVEADDLGEFDALAFRQPQLRAQVVAPVRESRTLYSHAIDSDDVRWDLRVSAAAIAGTIRDAVTHEPLAGVVVVDHAPNGLPSVTTGEDGTYRIDAAVAGAHRITVNAPQFLAAPEIPLRVVEDELVDSVDFALQRGHPIDVLIEDDASRAVASAMLFDRVPPDGFLDHAALSTDAAGHATVALADGEVRRVWAVTPDGRFAIDRLDARERTTADAPHRIVLPPLTATLRIRVTRNDKALSGAGLLLQTSAGVIPPGVFETIAFQQSLPATTNAAGELVVHVPPGSYILAAYASLDDLAAILQQRVTPPVRRLTVAAGDVPVALDVAAP